MAAASQAMKQSGRMADATPGQWAGGWRLSSSSDQAALAVVDGTGRFAKYGPHYSRRTPGSRTFTGVGQEIVLLHESGAAVWAVVRQRTPSARGTGLVVRGRTGKTDCAPRFIWRKYVVPTPARMPVIGQ